MATVSARARQRRQIEAMLEEVNESVVHLSRPVLAKLAPYLRQAQHELHKELRAWAARENGEAEFTAQRLRNALVAVRKANGALESLVGGTKAALAVGGHAAGQLAMQHLEHELRVFGGIFEGSIIPIPIEPAAIIAKGDKLLLKRYATSAKRYAGRVRDSVVRELAVGRLKGETIFELTGRLNKALPRVFQGQRWDAERLARSETMSAYNRVHFEGLHAIHEDDPTILARWDASFDWRRCPACASLDGEIKNVAKGEKFTATWISRSKRGVRSHRVTVEHPPLHPNCFPGFTPVMTSSGWVSIESVGVGDMVLSHDGRFHRVEALSRNQYAGKLIVVRSGEKVVHATPNHPFAGEERWVRADGLNVAGDRAWVLERVPAVPQDFPTSADHKRFVGSVLNGLPAGLVPSTAVEFDVERADGDIGVESPDRLLQNVRDAESLESIGDGGFVRAQRFALPGHRRGGEFFGTALSPACGSVGGGRLCFDLLFGHASVAPGVVLAQGAHGAGRIEDPRNRHPAAAVALREGHGRLAGQVESNHLAFVQRNLATARGNSGFLEKAEDGLLADAEVLGDGIRGLPMEVEADDFILRDADALVTHGMELRRIDIATTETDSFVGVVYNLQVEGARTFVAGGFLVHNCRCVITPWRAEWEDFARPRTPAAPHELGDVPKVRPPLVVR